MGSVGSTVVAINSGNDARRLAVRYGSGHARDAFLTRNRRVGQACRDRDGPETAAIVSSVGVLFDAELRPEATLAAGRAEHSLFSLYLMAQKLQLKSVDLSRFCKIF